MKNFIKKYSLILFESALILLSVVVIVIFQILKGNKNICEWYSRNIGRWIQTINGAIVKYIPFSIMETFFILLFILVITLLVVSIIELVHKRIYNSFSSIIMIPTLVLLVIANYNAYCTLQYNRKPVPLESYNGEVDEEKYEDIIQYFLDDFNYCSSQVTYRDNYEIKELYSLSKLNKIMQKEYKRLNDEYFAPFTSNAKPMMSSFIYREMWITGVYFAPFGESNINVLSTKSEIPYTLVHELAHSKGIMRENDANLVATYLTLTSDNPYIRYSGYINTFSYVLNIAHYSDDAALYNSLLNKVDNNIRKNWGYISKYWNSHNLANRIADWWNSLYLKSQGTENGTDDYDDTPVIVDPDTHKVVTFSNFQKIYLGIYFANHPES